MPFRHVKAAYERLREKERLELQKYLLADKKIKDAGLEVIKGQQRAEEFPAIREILTSEIGSGFKSKEQMASTVLFRSIYLVLPRTRGHPLRSMTVLA